MLKVIDKEQAFAKIEHPFLINLSAKCSYIKIPQADKAY